MNRLNTPDLSYSEVITSLNGDTYNLEYRYLERTKRWKLGITDSEGTLLAGSVTIMEQWDLTGYLSQVNKKLDGFLFTVQQKAGDTAIGRSNLGINKTHELVYISYAEQDNQ